MASPRPTRRRTILVAGAAALAVVTTGSGVSAHDGTAADGTIHVCANDVTGAVRVLADAAQECRRGETPLHWTTGGGASEVEVDWSDLTGVPSDLADGQVTGSEVFGPTSPLSDGAVSLAEIVDLPDWLTDGDVSYADITGTLTLPAGSVSGGQEGVVADGSLTAHDLAGSYAPGEEVVGAVTGEKIADGSVEPRDLRPEIASATTGPAPVALSSASTEVGTAGVTAAGGSLVMVSGQVQLTCATCTDGVVSYQLTRAGTGVGPVYRVQLSTGHAADVAGFSHLDTVDGDGSHQYALQLSIDGSSAGITASNLVLTAQVLGPS